MCMCMRMRVLTPCRACAFAIARLRVRVCACAHGVHLLARRRRTSPPAHSGKKRLPSLARMPSAVWTLSLRAKIGSVVALMAFAGSFRSAAKRPKAS